jgi:hypothetical protein
MAKRKSKDEIKDDKVAAVAKKVLKIKTAEKSFGRPELNLPPEMKDKIFMLIETTSAGLQHICKANPELPSHDTIYRLINSDNDFSERYLAAKQKQIMAHMEETYALADDMNNESAYYIDERGNRRIDPGWISWKKQQIELRKWNAARLAPKIFGDRLKTESTVAMISPEEALKLLDK